MREFRPDLKGIATCGFDDNPTWYIKREFRPDLKGMATPQIIRCRKLYLAERIQTRFKGDCDLASPPPCVINSTLREFRPDLKGIATSFIFERRILFKSAREFRPDLKGIATFLVLALPLRPFLERIQTRFKGDCDLTLPFLLAIFEYFLSCISCLKSDLCSF